MTSSEICELEALWEFFEKPRSSTSINNKLLKRLKELVTLKLREENERKENI